MDRMARTRHPCRWPGSTAVRPAVRACEDKGAGPASRNRAAGDPSLRGLKPRARGWGLGKRSSPAMDGVWGSALPQRGVQGAGPRFVLLRRLSSSSEAEGVQGDAAASPALPLMHTPLTHSHCVQRGTRVTRGGTRGHTAYRDWRVLPGRAGHTWERSFYWGYGGYRVVGGACGTGTDECVVGVHVIPPDLRADRRGRALGGQLPGYRSLMVWPPMIAALGSPGPRLREARSR